MKKLNFLFRIFAIVFIVWLGYFLSVPYLIIESESGLLLQLPVKPGEQISLRYNHSVQKTEVIENIIIQASGKLVVDSTEYESFGVGLPFLASEGKFRQVGNRFILENIGRSFDTIGLRAGPEAQLKIQVHGKTYAIFEMVPSGSLVHMRVTPYYSKWLNNSQ